ncbi:TLC domain-containing protein 4-B-like isoform X3 [Cyprinus carpio]|uniref:TLC domain-containing protein 4-B-like isoform X3 n=1 Tax=Cyprinus carpio TaxID=7962 RepID=A0A9Q9ZQS7_CYPCA|nr:TLC domain-containing protein 4-B-like isoform X3 [Cyprinus carpio]
MFCICLSSFEHLVPQWGRVAMDPFSQLILLISVVSFCTFQWLFHSVSPWASSRISPGFLKLNHKQKIEWNSRTVSTLHALLVGLFCLYILFFDEAVNQDPVWGDPTLVKINGQGMLPYFANFRLLAEFSTPCVNQRWFFEVLGYPKVSKPNMANGVLMAFVFFLVRIAVMPVYYSRMCSVYGTEAFYKVSFGGRSAWIFSSICLDIMNVMWMHKIARGCYKVLLSSRRSKPESQENGKTN